MGAEPASRWRPLRPPVACGPSRSWYHRAHDPRPEANSALPTPTARPRTHAACRRGCDVPSRARALRRGRRCARGAQPQHGVPEREVPQPRGVLQRGHGDVPDHGRCVHARLPFLRGRVTRTRSRWTPPSRSVSPRPLAHGAEPRRDHVGDSRRRVRRRGGALRRDDRAVRDALPEAAVEVLTSDFAGDLASVDVVAASAPDVFNHNLETVPRLYASVRPQADVRAFACACSST